MVWLIPSIIATFLGTGLLFVVFYYLYLKDKERYLLVWAVGWFFYALRFALMLILVKGGNSPLVLAGVQFASLLSGLALAWGTFIFIERPVSRVVWFAASFCASWILISMIADFSFLISTVPTFFSLAAIYIWVGIIFFNSGKQFGIEGRISGVAFILWGIHKADYPFLRPVEWFAPYGYFIGAVLEFVVAFGILLAYFHKVRRDLEMHESEHSSIIHTAMDGYWKVNRDGRILEVNETYCKMSGYSKEELLQMHIWDVEVNEPEEDVNEHIQRVIDRGEDRFESRHRRKDSTLFDVEVSVQFRPEHGGVFISFLKDISDTKIAEVLLRDSEDKFRFLFHKAADPIYVADLDANLIQVNEQACHITGYSEAELLSMRIADVDAEMNDRQAVLEFFNSLVLDKVVRLESKHRKKNGEIFPVEIQISLVKRGDEYQVFGVARDVSERIKDQQEREKLQAQLQQAHKLESIGTLAGGIAHDFNNILTAILGYAEMAKDDCPHDSTLAGDLDMIIDASNRAKSLVQQILAFSRQANTEQIFFAPANLLNETLKMLRPSLPATIAINQDIDKTAGLIYADPSQLNQIVMNLCTNSFHAMENNGGVLAVSLKEVRVTDVRSDIPDLVPGNYIEISVADSGTGIPQEIKDNIFDPYFTTKETGKGTGMGLAIVHGIVKEAGGSISFTSSEGEGTEFRVYLPVVENVDNIDETPDLAPPGGSETIMVVDDEKVITDMCRAMLERLGYSVYTSNNSKEALQMFNEDSDKYDLVLTDQTMPGMTGAEISREMLKIRPDIPIIICTGFSSTFSAEESKKIGVREYLTKPVTKKSLAPVIRRVLNSSQ